MNKFRIKRLCAFLFFLAFGLAAQADGAVLAQTDAVSGDDAPVISVEAPDDAPQQPQDTASQNDVGTSSSANASQGAPLALTPPRFAPVDLGDPVKSQPLPAPDPDSLGLLSSDEGGLGASMWQGTSRAFVDRLLPSLELPTDSPALNDLARRLLTSVADAPLGAATGGANLTSLRIERLLALGDVRDAWEMAALARPGAVEESTLRALSENAFLQTDGVQVCARAPEMIAAHTEAGKGVAAWQQLLILCKLKSGDKAAAQLGVDLLHEQKEGDSVFLSLVEKNLLQGVKTLPRRVGPATPLTLAALRDTGLALPPALYEKALSALIPTLLAAPAADEKARLLLAEKAARQGSIDAALLGKAYAALSFSESALADPFAAAEEGARERALSYQAMKATKDKDQIQALLSRFVASLPPGGLQGATATLLADLLPAQASASFAPLAARICLAANRLDAARGFVAQSGGAPVQNWPLFALAGLAPDTQGMEPWLTDFLEGGATPARLQRAQEILALLEGVGIDVPEKALLRVLDGKADPTVPASPLLETRLRQASAAGRKGEAVLLALDLAGQGHSVAAVQALERLGLHDDARAYAGEQVAVLLAAAP